MMNERVVEIMRFMWTLKFIIGECKHWFATFRFTRPERGSAEQIQHCKLNVMTVWKLFPFCDADNFISLHCSIQLMWPQFQIVNQLSWMQIYETFTFTRSRSFTSSLKFGVCSTFHVKRQLTKVYSGETLSYHCPIFFFSLAMSKTTLNVTQLVVAERFACVWILHNFSHDTLEKRSSRLNFSAVSLELSLNTRG